ncbi:AGAP009004-PA-like protein [Anopheles sinensis]|uniref:HEAT repeat-containing protein 1 n=1 Tax=Anopheles sinensis TaxID=74873 RepID=A0A084VKE8_ANOSI|nr:AGAP009004-PA-like protein [Anopheles sinensis]
MATSLAAQLQRLAAPQTSVLVESRRKASILFDTKEAASKDREVIFDIGLSGLEELIQLNGAFARFEETLFDRNAMDLQRSVEDQAMNAMLDANVRKFFFHLSPYFMLQPAHKCLEWLIRRFNVHQFNRRDFVNFILPYHETRMFVRCIQTLQFQPTNDQLAFLQPLAKAGVPPSKRTIIEHFAAHPEFLKQYGKFLMEATTELGSKANALQAMFAFFCTTTLGVFESVESVTENYVVAVLRPVAAGLAFNAVDYASACYMIVGQLVTKTALSVDTLELLTKRLCCAEDPTQRTNAVMLLVLIFQTQHERLSPIPNKLMKRLISTSWIPQVLSEVKADGIDVLVCYRKILETSLGEICRSFHSIGFYSQICEQLLWEIALTDTEAEDIIQCVLDSYIGTGKQTAEKSKPPSKAMDDEDDETINLDSDSEEESFKSRHEKVTRWYSEFLKSLERQYPTPFDRVVKRAMKGQEQYSHRKRNALKNVLGFLLQASCDENEAYVFENLFHFDADRRSHAVKYIVENFDRLTSKRRGRLDLLRESISERLDDDSCVVVKEVLRLSPAQLLKTVGADALVAKLNHLTLKCAANQEHWKKVTGRVIEMLTNKQIYTSVNINRVIIALYPLLFPLGDDPVGQENVESLIQTPFSKQFLVPAFYGNTENCDVLLRTLEETGQCTNPVQVCFNILLLSSALPSPCSVDQADRVLRYARKQLTGHRFQYAMTSDLQCLTAGKLPVDLITVPIRHIIERVRFDPTSVDMSFDRQNAPLRLRLSIFSDLLQRYCIIDPQFTDLRAIFGNLLKTFLTQLYPDLGDRVEFLSHFYTVHLIERRTDLEQEENSLSFPIALELQVRAQRLTNTMLGQMVDRGCEITFSALTNVILALTSECSLVRECAMSTIQLILQLGAGNRLPKPTGVFLRCLLKRREELSIDGEQLSLVMFTMREGEKGRTIKPVLESFIERLNDPNTPAYIAAGIVDMLKLLDDPLVLVRPATKAVAILKAVNGDKARLTFDLYESKMLQILLGRYTADSTEQVMRNEICQRVITVALQCHKAMVVPGRRKHCTPAILMIEALADELFEALPKPYAKRVLLHIVEAAALSEHPETNSATAKLFKGCTIDAALAVDLVADMCNQSSSAGGQPTTKSLRNSIIAVAPCEQVLSTAVWKRGVTLLEHLQNKKKLENAHLLVPKLFECLKYCLDFEEQSVVEYVKQIVLSLLLHCIVKVEIVLEGSTDVTRVFGNVGTVFKVEQIVQCIRGSQNPQTHHHALLLLGHVARYVPEQVLHNMMEIFTFVGSSIVRQDDAYSFQIISKTIETIVPTIAGSESSSHEQVIPILKIFSDIILDVPEHRRIALYVKLLQTLGADEYLWVFLGVLIESDVLKGGRNAEQKSQRGKSRAEAELAQSELSKRMEVALLIAREFEPTVIIQTCTNLIDYLRELPMEPEKRKGGEEEELMEVDMSDAVIFNVKAHTNRQLRHFKYALVQFVGGLVSSVFVINKIAQLNEEETLGMKKYYQNLIVGILTYVKDVSKTIDRLKAESADEKIPLYWRAMLNYCYDILESTISLLSADTLIIVVHGLLKHRFLMVRRKVLELLNNKLQYKQDYFDERHHPGLLKLLDPLMQLVKHLHEEESVVGTAFERLVIVQLCYISLRHLSKILTQHATKQVQSVLADLVAELHGYKKNPNPQILASLILCIGELCSNLGPHSINFLPKFMPMVNKFLNAQLKSADPVDLLTSSIVLSMVKIVDSLSRFLSPYLRSMLVVLAKLYALVEQRNDARLANMLSRLALIWNNLAGTIAPRVMIPAIEESYHELVGEGELAAIGPLMKLLSTTFGKLKSSDFTAIRGELAELFLTVLQFRCNQSASDTFTLAGIDAAEAHVIRAFVVLILKLSESTFRPLFYQVFEWSIRESSSNDRAITFFNVCAHVAEALKSLFVLFASDLVTIAAKLLNATNRAKVGGEGHEEELHFAVESKNVTLLRYVLKTLYCIVLYDNQNFINAVRFDMLLGPITDQLENGLIINVAEVRTLVIDCLAQMAVAVMDDSLWRQLNYQVLLKTRNNEPEVRMFALEACTEIARKLGESYAPLLPETIPFLAELMEDDNEDVEKAVHHSCREIGRATGEDLQKYF